MLLGQKTPVHQALCLGLFFGVVPAGWTRPVAGTFTAWQLGFYTTLPATDGTGGIEPSGSNYSRIAITPNDTTQWSITGNALSNVAQLQGPIFSGPISECVGWGLFDNGGVLRYFGPLASQAIDFTGAVSGNLITTATAHGRSIGDLIRMEVIDIGSLPTGLAALTNYFVISVPTSTTMTVSASFGGAAVTISAAGQGRLAAYYGKTFSAGDQAIIPAGAITITET